MCQEAAHVCNDPPARRLGQRDRGAPPLAQFTRRRSADPFKAFVLFPRAHDGDVNEANKLKGPQQGGGPAPYHAADQTAAGAQYLHQPSMQYPQQAPPQPGPAPPTHRPASYLGHAPADLQDPNANAPATGASQDPKSSVPNRAYQVGVQYGCAAPCFDR